MGCIGPAALDRPVDDVRSTLAITRDGKLVESLHPRLESAPEVRFARADEDK